MGTIEQAFRYLAKQYHPDHSSTADINRFNEIVTAHNVLKSEEKRAAYDLQYFPDKRSGKPTEPPSTRNDNLSGDLGSGPVAEDFKDQKKILIHLYRQRRENSRNYGVPDTHLERYVGGSRESIDFHIWYMKEKGLIERTDAGLWAITVGGIDHVMSEYQRETSELRPITAQVDP